MAVAVPDGDRVDDAVALAEPLALAVMDLVLDGEAPDGSAVSVGLADGVHCCEWEALADALAELLALVEPMPVEVTEADADAELVEEAVAEPADDAVAALVGEVVAEPVVDADTLLEGEGDDDALRVAAALRVALVVALALRVEVADAVADGERVGNCGASTTPRYSVLGGAVASGNSEGEASIKSTAYSVVASTAYSSVSDRDSATPRNCLTVGTSAVGVYDALADHLYSLPLVGWLSAM